MKFKIHSIQYFALLIYLCSLSAFQRDTFFESSLEVISFTFFVGVTFWQNIVSRRQKMKIDGMTIWYGVFIVFSVISVFWAVYSKSEVFFYIKKMIQIVVVTECITLTVRDKRDIESILNIVVVSLIFAGLLLISRTPVSEWGTKRAGLEIGLDENSLGMRMAIGIIVSLYFAIRKNRKKYIFAMIFFGLIVIFSGSKKAIIMAVIGCIGLYLLGKNTKNILSYLPRIAITIFALFGVGYAIFKIPIFYNVLGIRLERTLTFFISGRNTFDHSTSERLYYIEVAKKLFKEHPLFGVGLNNFKIYLSSIYTYGAYSHCNYWELLSCLGIVGTAIFYSFHFKLLVSLTFSFKPQKDSMHALMTVILILFVFMDYANVSFMSIFQYLVICLIYHYVLISRKEYYRRNE